MVCNQNHRNWIVKKKVPLFAGCNSWTFNLANDRIDHGNSNVVLLFLDKKFKILLSGKQLLTESLSLRSWHFFVKGHPILL